MQQNVCILLAPKSAKTFNRAEVISSLSTLSQKIIGSYYMNVSDGFNIILFSFIDVYKRMLSSENCG